MFKFDFVNSIYILLMLSFLVITFSSIVFAIKEFKSKIFYIKREKSDTNGIIGYLRKLIIRDYVSYEKYDIWRFCVEK